MRSFLVFQLYGPMTSWGDIAVGEVRAATWRPARSAVFGLLAAALGIKRDQEDVHREMTAAYAYGARVESPGVYLRDYHTVQTPHGKPQPHWRTRRDEMLAEEIHTILSRRDYYLDTYATIAVWATRDQPPFSLEELAEALAKPHFVLYLGRKASPFALPLSPRVVSTETMREALLSITPDPELVPRDGRVMSREYIWEQLDAREAGLNPMMMTPRHDLLLSRRRWQFGPRDEFYAGESITGEARP